MYPKNERSGRNECYSPYGLRRPKKRKTARIAIDATRSRCGFHSGYTPFSPASVQMELCDWLGISSRSSAGQSKELRETRHLLEPPPRTCYLLLLLPYRMRVLASVCKVCTSCMYMRVGCSFSKQKRSRAKAFVAACVWRVEAHPDCVVL